MNDMIEAQGKLLAVIKLIEDGVEFSVAIDNVVFETGCDKEALIKAYDDETNLDFNAWLKTHKA